MGWRMLTEFRPDTDIGTALEQLVAEIAALPFDDKIAALNAARTALHDISPFATEPVDLVLWVPADTVQANDYNPNTVAPPEMVLLERSIAEDGYTQPIVAWQDAERAEVVDGFHRHRVGRESLEVSARVKGYLPLAFINPDRGDRTDRIASTIRHNRARGKHAITAMSDIVIELKRRNWTNDKIARELGMDQDEILRLTQITGLADLFSDQEFSRAWDVEGEVTDEDFHEFTDDISTYGDQLDGWRTVNTSDEDRIFHTHDKWECLRAGFYASTVTGLSRGEGEEQYRVFLSDLPRFREALEHVITEWKHSCEHYLTNKAMNRIAWLGQAAMCYATGVPATYRAGFSLLTQKQQDLANNLALEYLNKWLEANDRQPVSLEEAYSYDRQSDIY